MFLSTTPYLRTTVDATVCRKATPMACTVETESLTPQSNVVSISTTYFNIKISAFTHTILMCGGISLQTTLTDWYM